MEKNDEIPWLRKLAVAALACYWVALFIATHLPQSVGIPLEQSDKSVHLVAYCGLALLLCFVWWLRRPFGRWQAIAVLAILALYGAADEITQIPVGRHCDFFDWLADVSGTLIALAIFFTATAIYAWRTGRPRGVS